MVVEMGEWEGRFLGRRIAAQGAHEVRDWRSRPTWEQVAGARDRLGAGRPGLTPSAESVLEEMRRPLGLTLRGVIRCQKVAGTLAALDGMSRATPGHVREALEFRCEILAAGSDQG